MIMDLEKRGIFNVKGISNFIKGLEDSEVQLPINLPSKCCALS